MIDGNRSVHIPVASQRGSTITEVIVVIGMIGVLLATGSIGILQAQKSRTVNTVVGDIEEIHAGLMARTVWRDLPASSGAGGWSALATFVSDELQGKYTYSCASGGTPRVLTSAFVRPAAEALRQRVIDAGWCGATSVLVLVYDDADDQKDTLYLRCDLVRYDTPLFGQLNRPCL